MDSSENEFVRVYVQIKADEVKFSLSFSSIFSVKIVLITDRSLLEYFGGLVVITFSLYKT